MNATAAKLRNTTSSKISARPAKKFKAKGKKKLLHIVAKGKKKEATLTALEREELVLKFRLKARKLGRSILRKWHSRLDLQEVDSVVDLSLCEAVKRYNPNKGASFMTFLFYHLRGNLIRAVATAANANVVPAADHAYMGDDQNSEDGVRDEIPNAKGATAMEIADALSSQDFVSPDDALFKKELSQISAEACAKLDPLEREVIERIYMQEQQLMDIASMLGYSRCHISRVKRKALETLQGELRSQLGVEAQFAAVEDDEIAPEIERRKVHRRRPRAGRIVQLVPETHKFVAVEVAA